MKQGKYLNTVVVRDGVRTLTEHVNKSRYVKKKKGHDFSSLV